MGLPLSRRRWGRRDWIVAGAAVVLVFASGRPWSGVTPGDSGASVNAWANRRWSEAVALALVAAVLLLAYRSRNPRGAAALAVAMLVGALGLEVWEWHRTRTEAVVEVTLLKTFVQGAPEPSPEELKRQFDEAVAAGLGVRHRTEIKPAFAVGAAAMVLMLLVAARALFAARTAPEF